jgi:predicted hotdog family 3-hydroxylacyl-ACP dehydratase
MTQAGFPPLAELLPHAPPMVLLDEVLAFDGATARCGLTLRPDSMFVEGARVRAVVALEYMAQCVAVCASLRSRDRGEAAGLGGYLVGARELQLGAACFDVGDRLEVEATLEFDGRELGTFACTLSRRGERLASGVLNVYRHSAHPQQEGGG